MALLHLLRLPGLPGVLLLRGGLAWMILRFAAAYASVGIGQVALGIVVCGLAAATVLLDAVRRRETLFLANLGIPWWPVAATAAISAGALEGLLRAVAGGVGG